MSAPDPESLKPQFSLIRRPSTELIQLESQSVQLARRAFLLTSLIGGAGLAVAPLHFALAQNPNGNDNCPADPKPKKKGFWATFLFFLEIAATIFGFGGLFRTVRDLVSNIHTDHRAIAQNTITGVLTDLTNHDFPYHINKVPSSIAPYSPLGFVPLTNNFAADLRGFLQALRTDQFNGITTYFDFSNATASRGIAGQVSAPATAAIVSCAIRKELALYGYSLPEYLNAIVAPAATHKDENTSSMGNFNSTASQHDRYKTSDGVTVDISYQNSFDNNTGGRTEGEIAFHKLTAKDWSNKRMGIRRVNFQLRRLPLDDQGFGINYTKGDKPIVT